MTVRRVTLPVDPDAFWEFFAWPSKAPRDNLAYELDCSAWLTDGGLILDSVDVEASPGLTVGAAVLSGAGNVASLITVQIADGTPDTIATVAFTLHLDSGTKIVSIALEIEDDLPTGLILVGGGSLITADSAVTADSAITADA